MHLAGTAARERQASMLNKSYRTDWLISINTSRSLRITIEEGPVVGGAVVAREGVLVGNGSNLQSGLSLQSSSFHPVASLSHARLADSGNFQGYSGAGFFRSSDVAWHWTTCVRPHRDATYLPNAVAIATPSTRAWKRVCEHRSWHSTTTVNPKITRSALGLPQHYNGS